MPGNKSNIEFTLRQIESKEYTGKLYLRDISKDVTFDTFTCTGDNCLPIKPMIDFNSPTGMTKYFFDMNMINDMGLNIQASGGVLQEESIAGNSSIIKKKCFTCNELVTWNDMRGHADMHILK